MLSVVGHRDSLVDEKHRNAVLDAVRTAKPGVVEELVADQQQRPAVFRADEDAQQLFVEHEGRLADGLVDGAGLEEDAPILSAGVGRHARRQCRRAHARR